MEIVGDLIVMGNEPFTQLVLNADQGVFRIPENEWDKLWKYQNQRLTLVVRLNDSLAEYKGQMGPIVFASVEHWEIIV